MKRREFITLLGGAATCWPLAAGAQQPTMPIIGFLSSISLEGAAAFRRGLAESGYLESRDVSIQFRQADGNYDRLTELATELVSLRASLIVASPSSPAALAAKRATSTIPIVFLIGADPVQLGLVESYNRPGANATGIVFLSDELTAKRVELLNELVPPTLPLAFLTNPTNPNIARVIQDTREAAARTFGRELIVVSANSKSEIEAGFETIVRGRAGGLVVWQEAYFTLERALIVGLAAHHAIPSIYGPRLFTEIGGLMSYGANRDELYRQTGIYAGRILRGANPRELPVMQPTKFELVINLKTARALGLIVPDKLLALADEVIE
jgi:putative tryptophan/tyrosine transport system substrate-binding protein